jgi:hypothetical protein
VAIRTNDPCVEVLEHNCIFIQSTRSAQYCMRISCGSCRSRPAQSGTSCCNRLLVSGHTRPYRSIHALSPNSLTAHSLQPSESPALPPRGFHFLVGHAQESFLQRGLTRGYSLDAAKLNGSCEQMAAWQFASPAQAFR